MIIRLLVLAGALDYGLLGLSIVVLAGLGVMALTQDFGRPGDVYEPARVIDGKVVPGTTRPADGNEAGPETQAAD